MPAPVTPLEFEELVVEMDDSFCNKLIKMFKLMILYYKILKWERAEDGTITDDWGEELCPKVYPPTEV